MKIILNQTETGTELHIEVDKVVTPTGVGWSVSTSQGRTVLIKQIDGRWHAIDDHIISQDFWQMVVEEINRMIDCELIPPPLSSMNTRPKRARILRYSLVY